MKFVHNGLVYLRYDAKMNGLMEDRCQQLKTEQTTDEGLKKLAHECPCDVTRYLFGVRELNRRLSLNLYDAPFYRMPGMYTENMQKMDAVTPRVLTCAGVQEANAKIQAELRFPVDSGQTPPQNQDQ